MPHGTESDVMLAHYQILDHLGSTAGSDLYRACRRADDMPVLIKLCAIEHADRFRREYNTLQALPFPAVLRPLALFTERDRLVIVLEYAAGSAFQSVLARHRFDVPTCLRLACQLTRLLTDLHTAGLTHHDIRPANFLFDPEKIQLFLLDASLVAADTRQDISRSALNDWAYLSPEQTGRMNRAVDYRTDFYSLGVMLYQMLTGQLPIQGNDPLEFVHGHIAGVPSAPIDIATDVPQPVSDIVMRLLAKLPEERYQSARGLLADLEHCLTHWDAFGSITPFVLGTRDMPPCFRIAHKLYGREREMQLLLEAVENMATTGHATLITVVGYSGVGKSSLVQQLHQPIVQRHGYFTGGKFDQYRRDIPYATLTQAFRELVQQLLTESEERVAEWRQRILQAVGTNGQIIVDVLPQVELIAGKQPPVAPLSPAEAQRRFQQVFCRFISVFAQEAHPLVVFLDDLQWIDDASLNLIEYILSHPDTRYLLLVGAYRDNEVNPSHPLVASLNRIRDSNILIQEIMLAPLSMIELNQLIADTINTPVEKCVFLARLIFERTEGNPFFFIQFLDTLHSEGLLWYDAQERIWKWDLDQIQTKNFADNAVDLVIQKLHLLAPETQQVLRLAACLGNKFNLQQIALVSHMTPTEVEQRLVVALDACLVARTEDYYKFLHDRIQQAAYSLISEDDRAAMHLRIGRVLLANLSAEEIDTSLYDTVYQLNQGVVCIVERREKVQVAHWNLRAGRKAMASAAYATASVLFEAGLALLGEEGWINEHALAFDLAIERTRCEFTGSHFEETEQLIAILLKYASSPVEQATIYCQKLRLHLLKSENTQAIEHGLACLQLFGISLPRHPSREQVQEGFQEVWQRLKGRNIENLLDLPPMTDQGIRVLMQVLKDFLTPAYYVDGHLAALALFEMVKLSLRYGNSDSSATAYTSFGAALGPFFHRYAEGYRFAKLGCDLVEQNNFLSVKANVYWTAHLAAIWTQPLSSALTLSQTACCVGIETGDLIIACTTRFQIINSRLMRGDPLEEIAREAETALAFVRHAKYWDIADSIVTQQRFIANMRGLTSNFSTFNDAQFDEEAFEMHWTQDRTRNTICKYWITKLQARFLSGDYAIAMKAAEEAKGILPPFSFNIYFLDYFYYTALTVTALYNTGNHEQQRAWRELLTVHAKQLRDWAENCSSTFRDKYALVSAEIARVDEEHMAAEHFYQEAIDAANENGFPHNEGIAHELAARFYFARGLPIAGRAHLQIARNCYLRWGALGKVRQLDADPQLQAQTEIASSSISTAVAPSDVTQFDVLSVTKASQAISGSIMLGELIETLMRIVLENAGAQSGYLLLVRNGKWDLAADARFDQQTVNVQLYLTDIAPETTLPASILNYLQHTGESVLLPDTTQPNPFSNDPYFIDRKVRSVWCLPLRRRGALLGLLYLEHGLVTHVFTPARQAVLELLAAQAAISLENALLYADLTKAHDELEERVRERTEELARSNADLEQFAYVASHDLQEPLRMVASYLQLLEQRYHGRFDHDADEFITFAVDGAQRMQNLIKDLLAYSRIGTKAKPAQPVDIQAVMIIVLRSLGAAISDSGAQVEFNSLPQIMGDETQLMQLFQNLVANAIKFRGNRAPLIQVRAEFENGNWHFVVQDNGIGIPSEHFERIFIMFQRLHTRAEYPGTGIGLALCKKIVERHGGRIWVESSTAGSAFHFTLPPALNVHDNHSDSLM